MKKFALGIMCIILSIITYAQDYSEQWTHGSEVTITATPNPGWEFVNWTDRITGEFISTENPYMFIVEGNVDYYANFQKIILQLVLENSPLDGGITSGAGDYEWGSEVTISATPNEGYTFLYWLNNKTGEQINSTSHTFIIDENKTAYTAYYELDLYWINVIVNPEGAGSVTGTGMYKTGSDVSLYSEPFGDWEFENWVNMETGEVIEDNPYTFKVYENYNFQANFLPQTSIVDNSDTQIRVYPNPAKHMLYIETPVNSLVRIVTLNGSRVVINLNTLQTFHQVNVSTLEPSAYLIEVEINGTISYHKFIIQ